MLATGSSAISDQVVANIAREASEPRAEATPPHRESAASSASSLLTEDVVATPRRRVPIVWIGAGGVAIVAAAIVAVVALRGGSGGGGGDQPKRVVAAGAKTSSSKAADTGEVRDNRQPHAQPAAGSQMQIDESAGTAATTGGGEAAGEGSPAAPPTDIEAPAADGSAAVVPPPAVPPAVPAPAPAPAPKRTAGATLGGKKVVLEYDNAAPKETPKKLSDEAASIGAARITYFNGNRKLFAGDADGAVKLYRQALAMYPGYVAGYRGLGLAYAQKGDKANALKAFRTYLSAVPNAKDAALIRKRVATLQR